MKIVFLSRTLTSGWSLRRPLPWRLQSCDPLGALAVELVCTTAFSRRGCGGSARAWSEFVTYGMLCAGRAKGNEHRRENVFWAWVQIHQGTFEIYAQSRRDCHGDAPSHGRHMYVRYPPATVAPIGYRAFWSVRLRLAADRCQCQCRRCARVWCVCTTPCPCMHDPVSVYARPRVHVRHERLVVRHHTVEAPAGSSLGKVPRRRECMHSHSKRAYRTRSSSEASPGRTSTHVLSDLPAPRQWHSGSAFEGFLVVMTGLREG